MALYGTCNYSYTEYIYIHTICQREKIIDSVRSCGNSLRNKAANKNVPGKFSHYQYY